MEYFRLRAGFETIHVPYRSVTPLVVDLLAGQVKAAFVGSPGIVEHIREGRLRGLGVSSGARSPLTPNLPTIAESGYLDFAVETSHVLIAPAGMAEPIAALLERHVQTALKLPDLIERLRLLDIAPLGLTGPAVRERIKREAQVWAKVVAATNMRLD